MTRANLSNLFKLLLLVPLTIALSGCFVSFQVDGYPGGYYHHSHTTIVSPAPQPYYTYVYEEVRYGCCVQTVERRVQVFWHSGYQAWGYWAVDGGFIYY